MRYSFSSDDEYKPEDLLTSCGGVHLRWEKRCPRLLYTGCGQRREILILGARLARFAAAQNGHRQLDECGPSCGRSAFDQVACLDRNDPDQRLFVWQAASPTAATSVL